MLNIFRNTEAELEFPVMYRSFTLVEQPRCKQEIFFQARRVISEGGPGFWLIKYRNGQVPAEFPRRPPSLIPNLPPDRHFIQCFDGIRDDARAFAVHRR